jgi:hypothetical protein
LTTKTGQRTRNSEGIAFVRHHMSDDGWLLENMCEKAVCRWRDADPIAHTARPTTDAGRRTNVGLVMLLISCSMSSDFLGGWQLSSNQESQFEGAGEIVATALLTQCCPSEIIRPVTYRLTSETRDDVFYPGIPARRGGGAKHQRTRRPLFFPPARRENVSSCSNGCGELR